MGSVRLCVILLYLMPICFGFYFALRRTTQFTSLFGFYIHRWICLFINNSKTSVCPVKMLQRYTCISVGKYRHSWSFFVQTVFKFKEGLKLIYIQIKKKLSYTQAIWYMLSKRISHYGKC